MDYEIMEVDGTFIVIANDEPMFLNETAAFIVKHLVTGKSNKEIVESIYDNYEIEGVDKFEVEESVKSVVYEFERHVKNG